MLSVFSSQTGSPSEQGLMALAAFGLLSRDHTLANAAITEIEKHPDYSKSILILSAAVCSTSGPSFALL